MSLSGMGEDVVQVGLMYKNRCFIKCYVNIFVFCNCCVFIILCKSQFYKCSSLTIYRHPRYSAMKSGDKRWRYIRGWLYVNTVNSELNRFSSESDSSRSLTVRIECREGGETVEFVHFLTFRNEQPQNFVNFLCHVCLLKSKKSRAARRIHSFIHSFIHLCSFCWSIQG